MHTARKYLTFLWMVLPAAHLPRKESLVKHAMKIPEVLLFVANVNLPEKNSLVEETNHSVLILISWVVFA